MTLALTHKLKERKFIGFTDTNVPHKLPASYPVTFPYCRIKNSFFTCQNSAGDVFYSGICFFHPRSLNASLIIHITRSLDCFFHSNKMSILLTPWICCCGFNSCIHHQRRERFYFSETMSDFLLCYFHTPAYFFLSRLWDVR